MLTIEEFNNRLIAAYDKLSPHLKKASKYILENPDQVAIHSMRTIAKKSEVHPTTMVRLAQKFSFEGYQELRTLYQEQFKVARNESATAAQKLVNDHQLDTTNVINYMRNTVLDNLNAVYENIDPQDLKATAKSIWECNHIYIVGFRTNTAIAYLVYYHVLGFSPDVTLIDTNTSNYSGKLRYIKPGEIMLVIASEPYSETAVKMTNYAIEKGADVIAITDSVVSPIAAQAKHSFIVPEIEKTGFNNVLLIIAICNLILTEVIREGGEESIRRLKYSDKNIEDFFSFD